MLASPCRRHGKRAPGTPDAERPTSYRVLETAPKLAYWLLSIVLLTACAEPITVGDPFARAQALIDQGRYVEAETYERQALSILENQRHLTKNR
jgi:hypothetical protein